MSSSNAKPDDRTSSPVPIPGHAHTRARSGSESSSEYSDVAETPGKVTPPRIKIGAVSPATSPVMSFFFPGSPTKTPGSMFGKPPTYSAVLEDDESDVVLPASAHARRFSSSWALPKQGPMTAPATDDRSSGLLRRLSLSNAFRPTFPGTGNSPPGGPMSAVPKLDAPPKPPSPGPNNSPRMARVRRSATIAVAPSPKARAPSPMGERILKGHFDGFV